MKLRNGVLTAAVVLAMSALFAATASADEPSRSTICVYNPTSDAIAPRDCISFELPSYSELNQVSNEIVECWQAKDPNSKAALEDCAAALLPKSARQAQRPRAAKKKKRHHRAAKAALAHRG